MWAKQRTFHRRARPCRPQLSPLRCWHSRSPCPPASLQAPIDGNSGESSQVSWEGVCDVASTGSSGAVVTCVHSHLARTMDRVQPVTTTTARTKVGSARQICCNGVSATRSRSRDAAVFAIRDTAPGPGWGLKGGLCCPGSPDPLSTSSLFIGVVPAAVGDKVSFCACRTPRELTLTCRASTSVRRGRRRRLCRGRCLRYERVEDGRVEWGDHRVSPCDSISACRYGLRMTCVVLPPFRTMPYVIRKNLNDLPSLA